MNPDIKRVSTRSRPKAAGLRQRCESACLCGFNTQPPEGGWDVFLIFQTGWLVSTRSRPKAAGFGNVDTGNFGTFQHAAARRRLAAIGKLTAAILTFQHAAARRRLVNASSACSFMDVFQHAAARRRLV